MASELGFVEYVIDQCAGAARRGAGSEGALTYRKMFGEYAVYLDGKVVLLVCDNQAFLKPTEAGRKLLGTVEEAPAYPGAKPSFLLGGQLEDRELMAAVVRATADALPTPKPKKPRGTSPGKSRVTASGKAAGASPAGRAPRR